MKKVILIFILSISIMYSSEIEMIAFDIQKKMVTLDFELAYKGHKSNVLYITKYQSVLIKIKNNSKNIININPNYFTLVSNKRRSYSYSPETYIFKKKVQVLPFNELSNVKLYPNTETQGFLIFDKTYEDEKPEKLYFDNNQLSSEIKIEIL